MALNIAVIHGSVRINRKGIRAARFITNKCKERSFNTVLIDPLDYNLPLLEKMYKQFDEGLAPELMQELSQKIKKADGYIS